MNRTIEIFTDGSCHTQQRIGAWVSILLENERKVVLSGSELDTTHHRMEILAVIKSLEFVRYNYKNKMSIRMVCDSQYVIGLADREKKIRANNFRTKSGVEIRNCDLVIELLGLLKQVEIRFEKIKAHQKKSEATQWNIEADKLSREIVRSMVKER